jgi:hypothetical protein
VRVVRVEDDRSEHAVDVEQDGGALWVRLEGLEQLLESSCRARHSD